MPKAPKEYEVQAPTDEIVQFVPRSGAKLNLTVYNVKVTVNQDNFTKAVVCDICGRIVTIREGGSLANFAGHRDKGPCSRKAAAQRDEDVHAETRAAIQAAFRPHELVSQARVPASGPSVSATVVPTPSLTPRASHSNLATMSLHHSYRSHNSPLYAAPPSPIHSYVPSAIPNDLPPSSPPADVLDDDFEDHAKSEDNDSDMELNECQGQWIPWKDDVGSVWKTYPYKQHDEEHGVGLPWVPVRLEPKEGRICVRSLKCTGELRTSVEIQAQVCDRCYGLIFSQEFVKFKTRSMGDAAPHTPFKFLNDYQMGRVLQTLQTQKGHLRLQVLNGQRKITRRDAKLDDHERLLMLMSQNKIAGVSRILAVELRNGHSPQAIHDKLQLAIKGVYRPRGNYSARDIDLAFVVKARGGSRLLYTMQKAEGYPSLTTLNKIKEVPEIIISVGEPGEEMSANIEAFLGPKTGRKPPKQPMIGQVLMIDGVALEEVPRFDVKRNCVLGLCREHSKNLKVAVDTIEDIEGVKAALENGECHYGKDGTVAGIAPVTGEDNYFVSPLVLSASCKSEKGLGLAKWVHKFLAAYKESPHGEALHGPIQILATDGESSFRKLRSQLCRSEDLAPDSKIGQKLYRLPGLNCRTGPNALIGTSDPKHIVKRFATKIRSPAGIWIGDTLLSSSDFYSSLLLLENMSPDKAALLLNPADKQNVPKAVSLLQSLFDLSGVDYNVDPHTVRRTQTIVFFVNVLSFFLMSFINVEMSLSEQIRSLSTYTHLLTALCRRQKATFLTPELIADSQAIVKSIIFMVAKLQEINPDIKYYILFEGTDRLEGVFSHARTQDHARNFDILQLAYKLSMGAEVNAIFERHPDLNQGHVRRDLVGARGVDHINPASWKGDVRVGNVNLEKEYFAGRDEANRLLVEQFGPTASVNWDIIFANPNVDHLRPNGEYIGSHSEDNGEGDDELVEKEVATSTEPQDQSDLHEEEQDNLQDMRNATDPDVDAGELQDTDYEDEILNPFTANNSGALVMPATAPSNYLIYDGARRHKMSLVPRILESAKSRKSNMRTLRAQGVTIDSQIQKNSALTQLLSNERRISKDDAILKAGDLGVVLVRVDGTLSLALCVALSFRQGNAKDLPSINMDYLDDASVAIQICELSPLPESIGSDNIQWITREKYVQLLPLGKEGFFLQKHFATRISGAVFHPIAADVHREKNTNTPLWKISSSNLKLMMDHAWTSLEPDTDAIMVNLKLLPEVLGEHVGFPYKLLDNSTPFHFPAEKLPFRIRIDAPDPNTQVECRLCGHLCRIRDMRNHVGKHILRTLRRTPDPSLKPGLQIGINPCGWCGLEGCKTQLIIQGTGNKKTYSTSSNCEYQHPKMSYKHAAKYSKTTPCTNVPLSCPLCPKGLNQQPQTFWKYNLIHHLTIHHLTENQLPELPIELLNEAFIPSLEELDMGVDPEETKAWRFNNSLPGTDTLAELNEEASRKRAASVDSQSSNTSTKSRQPSPSKKGRQD